MQVSRKFIELKKLPDPVDLFGWSRLECFIVSCWIFPLSGIKSFDKVSLDKILSGHAMKQLTCSIAPGSRPKGVQEESKW